MGELRSTFKDILFHPPGPLQCKHCLGKKTKILKIQIRSAQNIGKVWISRKKSSWPHLGSSQAIFSMDQKNAKHAQNLPIFLGGPMGPIHPVWGHRRLCLGNKKHCVLPPFPPSGIMRAVKDRPEITFRLFRLCIQDPSCRQHDIIPPPYWPPFR